jgi:hypothetical protein
LSIRLNGSTSGYTEIDAPAVAGSNTLVLPTGNGSADQALVTNGSGTLSFADRGRMVLETAKASTSGTAVDFTSIPSWVKRITVMFQGVSTNGSSPIQVQLMTGSSVPTTSGYVGAVQGPFDNSPSAAFHSSGFRLSNPNQASNVHHASMLVTNLSSNTWSEMSVASWSSSSGAGMGSGTVSLSAALTGVRVTTVNGTDTFDAGSINILYEG